MKTASGQWGVLTSELGLSLTLAQPAFLLCSHACKTGLLTLQGSKPWYV